MTKEKETLIARLISIENVIKEDIANQNSGAFPMSHGINSTNRPTSFEERIAQLEAEKRRLEAEIDSLPD